VKLDKPQQTKTGFTIVELLIVVVVIAILAAITIIAYTGIRDRTVASVLQSDVTSAIKKIELYKVESGTDAYPTNQNEAVNAGVAVSEGNALTYWTPGAVNSYCIQVVNGSTSYFATNGHSEPTPGTCYQLIGWWSLNSTTGEDWSGLGLSADDVTSTPALTANSAGTVDSALQFNGSQSVGLPNTSWTSGTRTVRTMSIWFRADSTGGTTILYEQGGSSHGMNIVISNGTLYGTLYSTGWNESVSTTITAGDWHHFAVVYSGPDGTIRGYLDGSLIDTSTAAGASIQSHTGAIALGRLRSDARLFNGNAVTGFGYGFTGAIDDFRLYNTTLDEAAIQFMYKAGPQ
jgi:prepilin-type N-terminal cleavage/methylation domain-containing protein